MNGVLYKQADGVIVSKIGVHNVEHVGLNTQEDQVFLELIEEDEDTDVFDMYVDLVSLELVAKYNYPPVSINVTGMDISITDIKANTTVTWPDGLSTTEDDGELSCSVNVPGEYIFRFSHGQCIEAEVPVNVA